MGQKRSYKQYPKELKEEAVVLVLDQGYSVPEAAKSLGIASNSLGSREMAKSYVQKALK